MKLPFGRCDVIFDDAAKKATSMHAKVLAPDQVRLVDLHTHDGSSNRTLSRCTQSTESTGAGVVREVPDYDPRTTWVLFPDEGSSTFAEALAADGLRSPGEVTIVAIDSPWRRAKALRQHPNIARLRSVRLARPPPSNFWRYHAEGEGCVSTVEALAQLAREARDADVQRTADGGDGNQGQQAAGPAELDGDPLGHPLLFFFARQLAHMSASLRSRGDGGELPTDARAKDRRAARVRQREARPGAQRLRPRGGDEAEPHGKSARLREAPGPGPGG